MPYISQDNRQGFAYEFPPRTAGDLNYVITLLLTSYIGANGKNYRTLNEVVGVLECAKLELYRRVVAPYEDRKCEENGDVY